MRGITRLTAILIVCASVAAATGCSKSGTAPASGTPGAAPAATAKAGPPTASDIQAQISKINSDPRLSPAQKQMMLNESQHALTAVQPGGGPPQMRVRNSPRP